MTSSEPLQRYIPRIGVLWRGSPGVVPAPDAEENLLLPVLDALKQLGLAAEAILFSEERLDQVRDELLALDGLLVWVDPIDDGRDRTSLDALLRDVASAGLWVSAHPDVILKMGTKDVLVSTRSMEWGTECYIYKTVDELRRELPERLAHGPRVLKQHRGNGGNGVWKLEAVQAGRVDENTVVHLQHARRGSMLESLPLKEAFNRLEGYFAGEGCLIDQPYQARLGDGMIRCYLVQDRVVGFGQQFVTALLPPPAGSLQSPAPQPRRYYGPAQSQFHALKQKLETSWVPEMRRLLDLSVDSLPVIWDADFLFGPRNQQGEDTYVLCETNVSFVLPFPDEALAPLADAVARKFRG